MNVFLPESLQTQIELEEIACVEKQIITPTTSKTIVGIVQDGLLGAYNLTSPAVRIDWRNAMNIMSYTSLEDFALIKKDKEYTGLELYSLIIPLGISVNRPTLKIKNGQLVEGRLSKDVLGAKKKNNLVQLIWDGYGVEDTKKFIDNTQRLVNNFNLWHGFSVGIGDIHVESNVYDQINEMFKTKELKVEQMITEMENNPEFMPTELFEHRLFSELNIVRDNVSKLILGNMKPDNAFNIMASSGSKGDATNIGQMAGCLGLQAFEGKIMPKKYNGRTLAYFHQHDDRAVSRGLVKQPFIRGLEFPEFVFHLMASRLGLIDTAIKSVSGDTPIIIQEDGHVKRVLIGDWIDEHMKNNADDIKHEKQKQMELLTLKTDVMIPTCDGKGNVSWEKMTEITRHDPTDVIYEITTYSGRTVVVADSKSLLIWNDKTQEFEGKVTNKVKIGDFVPVTQNLGKPPKIHKYIDMTKYFPKTEYLYGTDYHVGDKMTRESLREVDNKTPAGFWEKHNGVDFTLPFWRAAGLLRSTSGRSDTDCIKDEYVYPFSKCREFGLPDKFELNRDNGVFIGLFLADGNVDLPSKYIQITKEDESIQKFVCKWFDSYGINWRKNVKEMTVGVDKNIHGTSTDIRATSTLLSKFLTKLVGSGSANKCVPEEAYDAPDEFVIGLLDGYFSGDGCVSEQSVDVGSTSPVLIEGISSLCARFKIFGKISKTQQKKNNLKTKNILPMYNFSIRGQWAINFQETIKLTHDEKNKKLIKMIPSKKHKSFETQSDVVLDKIISITKLNVKDYDKLYDVTVPATLNFQIASGLNCLDTAQTGYTQRKLIKSMEDIMIKYDGTVRNANDRVIQFVYGDSGVDTTKQYEYVIKMIEMNNEEMTSKFIFTPQELKAVKGTEEDNIRIYDTVIQLRDVVRNNVRKAKMNYIILVANFMLPLNINRILDTIGGEKHKSTDDLTPKYILDQIEKVLTNDQTTLIYMSKNEKENDQSFKMKDEKLHKTILRTALYDAIHPKRIINELKLNRVQFDKVIDELSKNFNKNMIEPGEMAGIVAAQSCGEPLTQLTLNSVDWPEKIMVRLNGKTIVIEIGKFIDDLLGNNKEQVQYLGDNKENEMGNVQYLKIKHKKYYIPSVDENGITSWRLIEAITKHLPINKDGTHTLVKIKTKLGREVSATKAKSFLTKIDNKIVPIRGDEIKVGMNVPITYMSDGVLSENAHYDEIAEIIEVEPTNKYVYDFTVEETKNFSLANGLYLRDSFHHSGIASMSATVQGVPRMNELLSVSKKPKTPQMVIYLEDQYMASKDMAHKIASHIKHTTLGDIRGKINVYYDPSPKSAGGFMENDNVKHVFFQHKGSKTNCQSEITGLPWLIRMELDREKMLDKEVTLLEIKSKFCNWWERRFADSKTMKKEEKKVLNKITQLAVLSNSDNDKKPVLHIRFNVKDADKDKDKFDITTIDNFIDFVIDKFKLKGINSITDISAINEERIMTFAKETGTVDRKTQYVIYATGVNFNDVRYLTGIDLTKTISNHVIEVYNTFGIEIARSVLLREVTNAYERAGGEVNYQHVSMIVDQMTATGTINSVDRHGMNKSDSDPLSRASFEKTVEQLLTAAVYGQSDHMRGVSSRIMVGSVIKGGTGYCELELDTEMIEKSEYTEESDYGKKFTELNKNSLASDIIGKKNDADIFMPLS